MAACEELLPDPAVLRELVNLVAGYRMHATVSASLPEDHPETGWLPDGVGPGDALRS